MLLKAKDLRKTFKTGWSKKRKVCAVVKADISLNQGEIIGIVGETASGKTTLGLMLSGLLRPDRGHIYFKGKKAWSLRRRKRELLRRQIQIVFQHPESTFNPKWKLRRSVLEPFFLYGIPFSEEIISKQLGRVGLDTNVLNRYPSQLSGGELQRIAISRIMSIKPAVVILDEPTSMLDTITQAQIIRLLLKIQKQDNIGYVFISHDQNLVELLCKKTYKIDKGVLEERFSQ